MTKASGVFAGEVTPQAPAHNSPTSKRKGYHYFEYAGAGGEEYIPKSGEGYTFTQNNFIGPDPSLVHPFQDQSWDEITMSVVFKATALPYEHLDGGLFAIMSGAGDVRIGFSIRRRPINNQIFLTWRLATFSNEPINGDVVGFSVHELSIDHPTWAYDDWYWCGISYSQPLNLFHSVIRNLTKGEETVETARTVIVNNYPIAWVNSANSALSFCGWGLHSFNGAETRFQGVISQELIHDKYMDLSILTNSDKFVRTTGVIDLNDDGSAPFGEIPKVFNIRGYPQENTGTNFIGDLEDLWERVEFNRDTTLPPVYTGP